MNINELRIGNLVTWADEDTPDNAILTVTGINYPDIIFLEWEWQDGANDSTDCDLKNIKPIPLTEEWLKQLGFKPSNGFAYSKWMCEYENTSLIVNEDMHYYGISIKGELVWCISRQLSVHQLQNLYFLLTRKELLK